MPFLKVLVQSRLNHNQNLVNFCINNNYTYLHLKTNIWEHVGLESSNKLFSNEKVLFFPEIITWLDF